MNIDTQIRSALAKGQIRAGDHCHVFQAVVVKMDGTILMRVSSDHGFMHALVLLVARTTGDKRLEQIANEKYPRSVSFHSTPIVDRFMYNSHMRICMNGSQIQVDHHRTAMESLHDIPGSKNRTRIRKKFSRALKAVLTARPLSEISIIDSY